jgi:hypothetical protein
MSSSKPALIGAGLLLCLPTLGSIGSRAQSATASLTCPATITVSETSSPIKGWTSSVKAEHRFERVSIFNGKPGEQEFELAPDDQKEDGKRIVQTWNLKVYRTMNVFLRCRYRDTEVVQSTDVPGSVELHVDLRRGQERQGHRGFQAALSLT